MAAIVTERFAKNNADQFLESFSESSPTYYYMFLGKSSSFNETNDGTGVSDNAPPTPIDDVSSEYYTWDDMIAAKRINSTDVSNVIPRRDYTIGNAYDMYEHNISSSNQSDSGASRLWDSTFFYITSANRVYKVLDNNNNAVTTAAEPTSEAAAPFETSDGYTVKYLYTLTANQADKFLTSDFMAVSSDDTAETDGQIDVLKVENVGAGIADGTYYMAVQGDGSSAVAEIVVSSNAVARFNLSTGSKMQAKGSGYTFGTIDFSEANYANIYTDSSLSTAVASATALRADSGTPITTPTINPIIGPRGGHGKNPINELGGHYVMMNTKFEQDESNDLAVGNDFRRIGVVSNPYQYGTTTSFTASTGRQTYAVLFSSATDSFDIDEKITQATTGAVGKVVEYDATNRILYYVQERFEDFGTDSTGALVRFSGANDITGGTSGAVGTVDTTASTDVTLSSATLTFTAGYNNPELEPDSGNIIYIENRRPISRASDQTEDIKIIVEF
jgi:hypothetical protein